jgi:hypothetical protein
MVAALGHQVSSSRVRCEPFEASSSHYFERMGLFKMLGIESGITIRERDSTGRFIPLTQIRDSESLSQFITEMIPLLHLAPELAEPIRYIVSEIVRNVLEHASAEHGAFVAAQLPLRAKEAPTSTRAPGSSSSVPSPPSTVTSSCSTAARRFTSY